MYIQRQHCVEILYYHQPFVTEYSTIVYQFSYKNMFFPFLFELKVHYLF